ncbi:MAG: hypothetical protein JO186_05205 [Actinobacteria bacterium]|nr:hypothetical protein [Actinomycetota bacterium]
MVPERAAWARRRKTLASAVFLTAALFAFAGSAFARPTARTDQPAMVVSPNWSGYVATGQDGSPVKYTSVTGTWTVPAATCNGAASYGGSSTAWVGLGGYTTKNQEEVGTDSNCSAKGKPIYYAWFEFVPFISYNVFPAPPDVVAVGDTITGTVKIVSTTMVEVQVVDQTKNWTFDKTVAFSSQDTSTAEWIVEAPADCVRWTCHEANLANFGAITMHGISAVGNGSTGTLSDPDWKVIPIQLVPSKVSVPTLNPDAPTPQKQTASSPAGATPGPVSADGSAFSINWVAVANGGL